jgi:hypothetical protein
MEAWNNQWRWQGDQTQEELAAIDTIFTEMFNTKLNLIIIADLFFQHAFFTFQQYF